MGMSKNNTGSLQEWTEGDLVEYMRDFRPDRPKFGIVISAKKIVGSWELEVFWGNRRGFIDARLVKKRCK